jgi:hypothetical protein
VIHELLPDDKQKRVDYCEWFQNFVVANPNTLDMICFSDEAWFHLSGHVNSQNTRLWAATNPHTTLEKPLHSMKVGVWCAMSRTRIVGPIFFDTTLNTDLYLDIFHQFVNQLDDLELTNAYFQQDGATCHTSRRALAEIASFFQDRVVSKGLWPPRSPDLTPLDFFLWGMLKGKVYANKPSTIDELKSNISNEIAAIPPATLTATFNSMERRVHMCLEAGGDHFQHLL